MSDIAPAVQPAWPPTRNPFRRLYRWILSWAHHPMGTWMLALFAFLDSFIFPIPPLFLQVALSIERPLRSWWYATVNTVASVAGSVIGYLIGYALYESVGRWLIHDVWGATETFERIGQEFGQNAFLFILIYSFAPAPYKVITIASGFYSAKVPILTLLAASTIGRGFRFFALAALCRVFGGRVRIFVEKYFNLVMLGIGLLAGGILLALRYYAKR